MISNIKGTPQHKLSVLTSSVIGGLVNDLKNLEANGYDESICKLLKSILKEIGNDCQKLASSAWMSQIAIEYGDFLDFYVKWNGNGTEETTEARVNRRENLESFTSIRGRWYQHLKKNHKRNVGAEPDIAVFCDESVRRLEVSTDKYPDIFKGLNGCIKNYWNNTK